MCACLSTTLRIKEDTEVKSNKGRQSVGTYVLPHIYIKQTHHTDLQHAHDLIDPLRLNKSIFHMPQDMFIYTCAWQEFTVTTYTNVHTLASLNLYKTSSPSHTNQNQHGSTNKNAYTFTHNFYEKQSRISSVFKYTENALA